MNNKGKQNSFQTAPATNKFSADHKLRVLKQENTAVAVFQSQTYSQKNRSSDGRYANYRIQVEEKESTEPLPSPNGVLNKSNLLDLPPEHGVNLDRTADLLKPSPSFLSDQVFAGLNREESSYRLKLAMSSADAFKNARGAAKGEETYIHVKKKYYQKAIAIMVIGGLIFSSGIVFAILHFADYFKQVVMLGPICLAIGLLMVICGLVWLPIIKTKLKRQENVLNRTFSL